MIKYILKRIIEIFICMFKIHFMNKYVLALDKTGFDNTVYYLRMFKNYLYKSIQLYVID